MDNTKSEQLVRMLLGNIGEDVSRDGLYETPQRVSKSWSELYSGYDKTPNDVLKWFKDDTDEMVVIRNVKFFSTCEHHMLPFFGRVDIGYIPNGKIVGVSKLARLVHIYSRRLQVQERLARQIGEALEKDTKGVAVHVSGKHLCMMARGVQQTESEMETNYMTGIFRALDNSDNIHISARAEFMNTIK